MMPEFIVNKIPKALPLSISHHLLGKRQWLSAFEVSAHFSPASSSSPGTIRVRLSPRRRKVARTLFFQSETDDSSTNDLSPPVFAATPLPKSSKGKKKAVNKSEESVRRSTRQITKKGGYKFESMPDKPAPRKKARSAKPVQIKKGIVKVSDASNKSEAKSDDANGADAVPFTPIHLLQKIGQELQIPPEECSVEKLNANPEVQKPKKSSNDKKAL